MTGTGFLSENRAERILFIYVEHLVKNDYRIYYNPKTLAVCLIKETVTAGANKL